MNGTTPAPAPASFWAWSRLALQDGPLKQTLLLLQDAHGLNASLVLWCHWTQAESLLLKEEDAVKIIGAVFGMDRYVVRRLREVRRFLATARAGYPRDELARLRADIHEAEMGGEALIHSRLEAMTRALAMADDAGGDGLCGEALFDLCRLTIEAPVVTADSLGPFAPSALFASLRGLLPDVQKAQKPLCTGSEGTETS